MSDERWRREQEEREQWRREFWASRPLWAFPDADDMVKKAEKHANEGDE